MAFLVASHMISPKGQSPDEVTLHFTFEITSIIPAKGKNKTKQKQKQKQKKSQFYIWLILGTSITFT